MGTLAVAVTQPPISADPAVNGRVVREAVAAAAGAGARLVLLPEGMVSGYAKAQVADWSAVDWASVESELQAIARLAAELGVWIVVGSAHRLSDPSWPHNATYVISDRGELVDRYDKRFCSHTETTRFYRPGDRPVVFEVDGFRLGIVVCVEINFPQLFIEYAELGVDGLLLPAYPVDRIFFTKARAYAAIHNLWIGLSVPRQSEDLMASSVIGPDGEVKAAVGGDQTFAVDTLDRDDPALHIPLRAAKPWRAEAACPGYYPKPPADDPRCLDRQRF